MGTEWETKFRKIVLYQTKKSEEKKSLLKAVH